MTEKNIDHYFQAETRALKEAINDFPQLSENQLIHAFAHFSSRIHLKLHETHDDFAIALLHALYPHTLMSVPSVTFIQFQMDQKNLSQPLSLPRHTRFITEDKNQKKIIF